MTKTKKVTIGKTKSRTITEKDVKNTINRKEKLVRKPIPTAIKQEVIKKMKCANKPGKKLRYLEDFKCPLWKKDKNGFFRGKAFEIDHKKEYSLTQDNSLKNLQKLCKLCHKEKTKRYKADLNDGKELSKLSNDLAFRKKIGVKQVGGVSISELKYDIDSELTETINKIKKG